MPQSTYFSFINRYSLFWHCYKERGFLPAMLLLFFIYVAFLGPGSACLPMPLCVPSNIWHVHTLAYKLPCGIMRSHMSQGVWLRLGVNVCAMLVTCVGIAVPREGGGGGLLGGGFFMFS